MRRYPFLVGALSLALLASLAAFNAFIDPFDVFGAPLVDGVNAVKHGIRTHTRTSKAYAVRRAAPRTIILGSSRGESAFYPSHPGFRARPVYNLAFSGAGIYEMLRYFEHAAATAPVEQALVAIDFSMFDATRARPSWDFDEGRLAVAADGTPQPAPWRDLASLLLSGDAAKESWWSLRHQRDRRTTYGRDGLRDEQYDIPEILNEYGGHRKTFLGNEQGFICEFAAQKADFSFRSDARGIDTMDMLRKMMDEAAARHVQLIVAVPPVHVRHLEVIRQAGLWQRFEDWKRRVAVLAAAHDFVFWDFAQASPVTTEPLPPLGDTSSVMHWFRESSHARGTAGAAALNRIFGVGDQVPDYGRRLDDANLDARLAADRASLAAWERGHREDVAEIAELLRRCRPEMSRYTSR